MARLRTLREARASSCRHSGFDRLPGRSGTPASRDDLRPAVLDAIGNPGYHGPRGSRLTPSEDISEPLSSRGTHYARFGVKVNIRTITVGNRHAEPGDPAKVAAYRGWLLDNPDLDLPAIDVRTKPNGTYRIHDGRHRFLAYVLAAREEIPVIVGHRPS